LSLAAGASYGLTLIQRVPPRREVRALVGAVVQEGADGAVLGPLHRGVQRAFGDYMPARGADLASQVCLVRHLFFVCVSEAKLCLCCLFVFRGGGGRREVTLVGGWYKGW
jgi:hypothetical protein